MGWLLAKMEQRFGHSLDELARRFDRSVSCLAAALVEALPETIQQVREGKILAQVAMKFLAPVARQCLEDCQRMAEIYAQHHCDTREANCMVPGAKARRRSANASWMIPRCFSKPSDRFRRKLQRGSVPNCYAIWRW